MLCGIAQILRSAAVIFQKKAPRKVLLAALHTICLLIFRHIAQNCRNCKKSIPILLTSALEYGILSVLHDEYNTYNTYNAIGGERIAVLSHACPRTKTRSVKQLDGCGSRRQYACGIFRRSAPGSKDASVLCGAAFIFM